MNSVKILEPGTAFSVTQTANWSDVFGAMYNVLFSITIVLAIGFTVFYAIKYMFSDIAGNKSYAKGMLMKPLFVVVGLGLAYLLWNDLNPSLLTSSPTFGRLANTVGGGVGGGNTGNRTGNQTQTTGGQTQGSTNNQPTSQPTGITCSDPNIVRRNVQNAQSACSSASCKATNGCNWQPYRDIIVREANAQGVDPRMVIAIMCRESRAVADRIGNLAQNGRPDCGLMQINSTTCTADIMEPSNNIRLGVQKIKSALTATSRYTTPTFTNIANASAAYNCCANGDNPNSQSLDCSTSQFGGYVPKWGCPINPGGSSYNMCAVNNYACEIESCVRQLPEM